MSVAEALEIPELSKGWGFVHLIICSIYGIAAVTCKIHAI